MLHRFLHPTTTYASCANDAGKPRTKWDAKARRCAAYYLVAFKPWSATEPPPALTWDNLVQFVISCRDMGPNGRRTPYLARFRMHVMNNVASNLRSTASKKWATSQYRAAEATRWDHDYGKESEEMQLHDRTADNPSAHNTTSGGTGGGPRDSAPAAVNQHMVQAILALQRMRDDHRQDDMASPHTTTTDHLTAYNAATVNELNDIFGTPHAAAHEEDPAPPPPTPTHGVVLRTDRDLTTITTKLAALPVPTAELPPDALEPPTEDPGCADDDNPSYTGPRRHPVFTRVPADIGVDKLNRKQRAIYNTYMTWAVRLQLSRHDRGPKPQPPRRLLIGGPGNGKTHLITVLMASLAFYGIRARPVAFQGTAAANIPGAVTIHVQVCFAPLP